MIINLCSLVIDIHHIEMLKFLLLEELSFNTNNFHVEWPRLTVKTILTYSILIT